MLKSILIGLDGTEDGNTARDLGISWAQKFDALAVAVAIFDEPGILAAEHEMLETRYFKPIAGPLADTAHLQNRVSLDRFSAKCGARGVRCKALEDAGTPYSLLLAEAQRCDLVVLGIRTHFEHGCRDQNDETLPRVLKNSPRPLVAVPNSPASGNAVVVAYDGSLQASRALYAFVATGLGSSRPVHILSVGPVLAEAAKHADRACDYLRIHDIEAIACPYEAADHPAEIILAETHHRDAGLLVMGAYGQPTIREFFIGSVTRAIFDSCPVPVFCFH